ncbi:MAG TPA: oxygenase MpaB family protein [Pseudomonas sp.]|jgi:uncharacterized protein (DUF2236 family)|nr:oxygenase MpaB family protein [Pseudomonas sp.]
MEFLRQRIERHVLSLSGLTLSGVDMEQPRGDPGLFGPQSVCWKVHSDFTSMLIGGISALMIQMLHPLALAGVWEHSNYRQDMLGRLRRTGQFIAGTTFASRADAERLIARVRAIHDRVSGIAPDGRPYAANDPHLLTWVHVAEVYSFLQSHLRYRNPHLSGAEQDRYYAEIALVGELLGARDIPRSRQQVAEYFQVMMPELCCDWRCREVMDTLLDAPAPSTLTRPFSRLMLQAGMELLPDWACQLLGIRLTAPRRQLIRGAVRHSAPVLRWAVRNGSIHRARRRMGLPPYG